MSQYTGFESKHYSKTARGKDTTQNFNNNDHLNNSNQAQSDLYGSNKIDQRNKSLLGRSKNDDMCCLNQEQNFNKTSSKLFKSSFRHHDPNMCVCQQCNCGRHLCKFKNVYPDLTKASIYQQHYDRKTPIPNVINRASEYDRLNGPHMDMDSNYMKDYDGKKGDPNQKFRPEDLLKTGGPCQNLTSYSSGFPGFRGPNQYVRHTDNAVRSNLPFMSRSTYTNAFVPKSASKNKTEKVPDNLKSRDLWMGKTTYGNFFQQPNPEDYAKRNRTHDKLNNDPKYGRQYETTYKNSFLGPIPTLCPAKIALETKAKGFFNSSKERFAQNTDFKSLDPAFHAISTSKHSYV